MIPAGSLANTNVVSFMAMSHATLAGESAFRIRIEDNSFNNVMLETESDHDVHKMQAHIWKDDFSNSLHLFSGEGCCDEPHYAAGSSLSVNSNLFVFYEVRIETNGQSWTNDFAAAEMIVNWQ